MTAHLFVLVREEQSVGQPELGAVLEALTAAARDHDRIRQAIIRHEAQGHSSFSPLRCCSDYSRVLRRRAQEIGHFVPVQGIGNNLLDNHELSEAEETSRSDSGTRPGKTGAA